MTRGMSSIALMHDGAVEGILSRIPSLSIRETEEGHLCPTCLQYLGSLIQGRLRCHRPTLQIAQIDVMTPSPFVLEVKVIYQEQEDV